MTRLPNHRPANLQAYQVVQMPYAANRTPVIEQTLEVHANVRQTRHWVRLGTPPEVITSELEMLQLRIKGLLKNIITPAADLPSSRPHKAYIEALSDFRIAISVWLLNVRRGTGIATSATMQYELHASKTEFLAKLWLNTIPASASALANTIPNKSDSLLKVDTTGGWQSKRSVHSAWSLVPQSM